MSWPCITIVSLYSDALDCSHLNIMVLLVNSNLSSRNAVHLEFCLWNAETLLFIALASNKVPNVWCCAISVFFISNQIY